jgi:hypothetical protein
MISLWNSALSPCDAQRFMLLRILSSFCSGETGAANFSSNVMAPTGEAGAPGR